MACPCLHKRWAVSTLTLTKSRDEEFVDESSHKNLAMLFQREAVTTKKCSCFWGLVVGWRDRLLLWVNVHTRPKTGLSGVEDRRMQKNTTHTTWLIAYLRSLWRSWTKTKTTSQTFSSLTYGVRGSSHDKVYHEGLYRRGVLAFHKDIYISHNNHD